MTNTTKKTVNPWTLWAWPLLMFWLVVGAIVRDVRQQGLGPALHFWGMLIVISLAIGLFIGAGIRIGHWWLKRGDNSPTETPKLS